MTLSKRAIKLIGIGTAWLFVSPFLAIATWLFFAVTLISQSAIHSEYAPNFTAIAFVPFFIATLLQCPTILLQFVLITVYVIHIVQKEGLSDKIRLVLCVGTFFVPIIVMPLYFLRYIWHQKSTDEASREKPKSQTIKPQTSKRVLTLGILLPLACLFLPFIVFAVQLVYGLFFQSPSFATFISPETIESTNQQAHYTITYPKNWSYSESANGQQGDNTWIATIRGNSALRLGVFITIHRNTNNFESVEQVASWGMDLADNYQKENTIVNRTLQSKNYKIGDEITILREYLRIQNGPLGLVKVTRHCLDNYRIHNKVGYILNLCTDDDEYPQVVPAFMKTIIGFSYRD